MTWIRMVVPQAMTLEQLLQDNGLPHDSAALTNIWGADANRSNHRRQTRPPHQLMAGEIWWVPPPPLPRDAILNTYACTGMEGSTGGVVQAIKDRHGPGANEQLAVPEASFTESYLLGLAFNQPFRNQRTSTPMPSPGEMVRYPTRRVRARTIDVAPSTQLQSSTNQVPTGDGPFEITVELAEAEQVLKVLDVVPEPRTVNAANPDEPVEAHWRPADGKVRFKITIEARAGEVTPTRVVIRVRKPDESVYYTEERTDWTTTGEHTWEWDGFTTPPPAPGSPETGDVDTRVLRGQLTIEVTAMAASGWSVGWLELANRHAKAGWLDVYKHGQSIEGFAYLQFGHANEDEGVWAATLLGSLLAAAVGAGLVAIPMGIDEADGGMSEETAEDYRVALGVTAGIAAGAWLGALIPILMASRLSDDDFNTFKGQIEAGFLIHWLREGRKALQIDGQRYRFQGAVRTSGGHDRIRFALTSNDITGRGCNLVPLVGAVFCPFIPHNPSHNRYVGAHEFGHSLLIEAVDLFWSMHHKGSTDLSSNCRRGAEGFSVPASHDRDLMIYYDSTDHWVYDQMHAAPVDALSWVELAQVTFKAM